MDGDNSEIPWAMSTIHPCRLVTLAEMDEAQIARARQEALMVARENGEHNDSYAEYLLRNNPKHG